MKTHASRPRRGLVWACLVLTLAAIGNLHAATVTWTNATGDGKWSTPGNWSTGALPTATATVVFDGTSNTNCNVDMADSVTDLQLNSGYTATVTLSANLTLTGSLTVASGTLNMGSATLTINKDITRSGSGVITPATSTLSLTTSNAATITGAPTFYNVTISKAAHVAVNDSMTVLGLFTYTGGFLDTGEIHVQGGCVQGTGSDGGTGQLIFDGAGDQVFTGSGNAAYGKLPNVLIDKPSGTLFLASLIRTTGSWDHIAGLQDPGTSTLRLVGSDNVTIGGQVSLFDLTIAKATWPVETALNDDVEIGGMFALATGTLNMANGKTLTCKGGIDLTTSAINPGTSTLKISGSSAQSLDLNNKVFHNIHVTNTQGTVTFTRGFDASSGTVTFDPGASLVFGYNQTFKCGALSWNGTPTQPISLRSSHASYYWKLDTAAASVSYVDVQRSNAISGAVTATQSIDSGNNLNWIFPNPDAVWDGGGADNNWSTAANWSGDLVPGVAANVTFNGTSTKHCTIDVPAGVKSVAIAAGYTGTIACQQNLTVLNDFVQSGSDSTFNAGSGNLSLNTFTHSGGTFQAGSGTHTVAGNFTHSNSAPFQEDTSTFVFGGGTNSAYSGTNPFNNAIIDKGTAVLSISTLLVNGTLSLTSGSVNGTSFLAYGDVQQGAGYVGGTATISFYGLADQILTGNGIMATPTLPEIIINKAGGVLQLAGGFCINKNWSLLGGSMNGGSSSVVMKGTPTLTGNLVFNNAEIALANNASLTVTNGSTVASAGTLTLTDGNLNQASVPATGTWEARGNVVATTAFDGGTGRLVFGGSGDHTFTGAGSLTAGLLPDLEVNKPAGTLTLASTIRTLGNWTHTAGTVDPGTSYVTIRGGENSAVSGKAIFYDFQINKSATSDIVALDGDVEIRGLFDFYRGQLNMANGRSLTVKGDVDLAYATVSSGTSTLNIAGSGAQWLDLDSQVFYNLQVTNTQNTVTFFRTFSATGAVTFVPGSSVVFGYNYTYTFGALNWTGTASAPIILRSSHASYNWKLSCATQSVAFVDVQRSNAISGTVIAYRSTNSGNNTNWIFPSSTAIWDGGGADNNWTTAANWSDDVVPNPYSDVIFNGTSSKNCTANVVPGTVYSISIDNGFTGTITTTSNLSITDSFSQAGGTFNAGANAHSIAGNFSLTGGQFQAGSSWVTFSGTSSASLTGSPNFNNLNINKSGGSLSLSDTVMATGFLNLIGGTLFGGALDAHGDVYQNGHVTGTSVLRFKGNADQALYGLNDYWDQWPTPDWDLPDIEIDKPGGTLTLSDEIVSSHNWTLISGIMDGGSSSVVIPQGMGGKTLSGALQFNDLKLYATTAITVADNSTVTVHGTLDLDSGDLVQTVVPASGTFRAMGDVKVNAILCYGGTVVFAGGSDQTLTGRGSKSGVFGLPDVEVNKTGGTLTLVDYVELVGDWNHVSGAVSAGASTVVFAGPGDSVVSGNTVFNNLDATKTLGPPGTVILANDIQVSGHLDVTQGELICGTYSVAVGQNLTVGANGSLSANSATFILDGSGAQEAKFRGQTVKDLHLVNAAGPVALSEGITASGTMTIEPGCSVNFKEGESFVFNTLNWTGTDVEPIVLRSATSSQAWNLSAPAQAVWYVDVQDSNATNGTITDHLGTNSGNNTNWVFIDDVDDPSIVNLVPTDGANINAEETVIAGAFADDPPSAGIDPASFTFLAWHGEVGAETPATVDPGDLSVDANGFSYAPNGGLQEGRYRFQATIADLAGNVSPLKEWAIRLDTLPPMITILAPEHDEAMQLDPGSASATFSDATPSSLINVASFTLTVQKGPEGVENGVTVDPGELDVTAAGFTYTPMGGFVEGRHVLSPYVEDQAQNASAPVAWVFYVDASAPGVEDVQPADGAKLQGSPATISASFDDGPEGAGLDLGISNSAIVKLDGVRIDASVEMTLTASGFSYAPPVALIDGPHTVEVTLTDRAGNAAAPFGWSFEVDTTGPQIVNLLPVDAAKINDEETAITGAFADDPPSAGINPASFTFSVWQGEVGSETPVTVDPGELTVDAIGFSYAPMGGLEEGRYRFQATIADLASNSSALKEWTVRLDLLPPSVTPNSPANGEALDVAPALISGFFSDPTPGSGISTDIGSFALAVSKGPVGQEVSIGVTPGELNVTATSFEYTPASGLAPGRYVLEPVIHDQAGNPSGPISWVFWIDQDAPVVTVVAPEEGVLYPMGDLTVTVDFDDGMEGSGVDPVQVTLLVNGNDLTSLAQPITFAGFSFMLNQGLVAGQNTISVTAKDRSLNPTTEQRVFFVGSAYPTWVWDGGGADANWHTAENWNFDFVPPSSAKVRFGATNSAPCDINAAVTVAEIEVQPAYTGQLTANAPVTVNGHLILNGGDWSSGSSLLTVYEDLTLGAGGGFDAGTGTVTLSGPATSTVSGAFSFSTLVLNKNASATTAMLANDLTVSTALNVTQGTLALSAGAKLNLAGDLSLNAANASLSALDATISFLGNQAQSADFGGHELHHLEVLNTGGAVTLSGGFTTAAGGTFLALPGSNLAFEASAVFAVNLLQWVGQEGMPLVLRSATPGTAWLLVAPEQGVQFVDVSDSDASAGGAIQALDSVNGGGNTNWIFDPPRIVNLQPQVAYLNDPQPVFSADYFGRGAPVDPLTVHVFVNEIDVTSLATVEGNHVAYQPLTPLADGTVTWRVELEDTSGNPAHEELSFELDTVAPELSNFSPQDDAWVNSSRPTLSADFMDAGSGVDAVEVVVKIDGNVESAYTQAGQVLHTPLSNLTEGAHDFEVEVRDRAGNSVSGIISFNLDTVGPQIDVSLPASEYVSVFSTDFAGTYSDSGSGVNVGSVRIYLDGSDKTAQSTILSSSFLYYSYGYIEETGHPHKYSIEVSDLAGNLSTMDFIFVVDHAAITYTWIGEYSSDWDNPENWSPTGIPGEDDAVMFLNVSNYSCVMDLEGGVTVRRIESPEPLFVPASFTTELRVKENFSTFEGVYCDQLKFIGNSDSKLVLNHSQPQNPADPPFSGPLDYIYNLTIEKNEADRKVTMQSGTGTPTIGNITVSSGHLELDGIAVLDTVGSINVHATNGSITGSSTKIRALGNGGNSVALYNSFFNEFEALPSNDKLIVDGALNARSIEFNNAWVYLNIGFATDNLTIKGGHIEFAANETVSTQRLFINDPSVSSYATLLEGWFLTSWNLVVEEPALVYGVEVRGCNANEGSPIIAVYSHALPSPPTYNWYFGSVWTGSVDSNWNNASNWAGGVPTASTEAFFGIYSEAEQAPPCTVNASAEALKLHIGAYFATSLTVNNPLTVHGALETLSGSIVVNNTLLVEDAATFDQATVVGAGGTLTVEGDLRIVNVGSVDLDSLSVSVQGDLSALNSALDLQNGSVQVDGAAYFEGAELESTTGNLTVGGSLSYAGTSVDQGSGEFTIGGELYLLAGQWKVNSGSLQVGGDTFLSDGRMEASSAGYQEFAGNLLVAPWSEYAGNSGSEDRFVGGSATISGYPYLGNLVVDMDNAVDILTLNGSIRLLGDFTVTQGQLDATTFDATVHALPDTVYGPANQTWSLNGSILKNLEVHNTQGTITFQDGFTALGMVKLDPGTTAKFEAGATFVFSQLNWHGTAAAPITLSSTVDTQQWILRASNSPKVSFVQVRDSDASAPGQTILAFSSADTAPPDSNLNWQFEADDTTPPQILALTPSNDAYVATMFPECSASFTDGDGVGVDVSSLNVTLSDGTGVYLSSVTADGFQAIPGAALAQGQHTLTVSVKDYDGNLSSVQTTFFVDTIAPTISTLQPSEGACYNSLTFMATYGDDAGGSGIDMAALLAVLDMTQITPDFADSSSLSFSVTQDGTHVFHLEVQDLAGNKAIREATACLDTTPPPAPVIESVTKSGNWVVLSGPLPEHDVIAELLTDSQTVSPIISLYFDSWTAAFQVPGAGVFALDLHYVDMAGNIGPNSSMDEQSILDPEENPEEDPPGELRIGGLSIKAINGEKLINRSGQVLTAAEDLRAQFDISGGTAPYTVVLTWLDIRRELTNQGGMQYEEDFTDVAEGRGTFGIEVTDAAGEIAAHEFELIVDRTGPEIKLTWPLKATTADLDCLVLGPRDIEIYTDPGTQDPDTLRNVFAAENFIPAMDVKDEGCEPVRIKAHLRKVLSDDHGIFTCHLDSDVTAPGMDDPRPSKQISMLPLRSQNRGRGLVGRFPTG
ncbi:MAG: Ig-like domain-containing protein [Planctomycetota bacterium]|nr:Ig-like domain-containing protein [Planctomycetota bacterium]